MFQPRQLAEFAFFLCVLSGALLRAAPSQAADDDPTDVQRWYAFYEREAVARYQLVRGTDSSPLHFETTPILRWTNPLEDGQIHGAAYVWSLKGRPVVVGQLFSYLNGKGGRVYCHAFHSLADGPLVGSRDGQTFWSPAEAGLQLREVPESPPPHASRTRRLSQMRDIARRFSAYTEEQTRGKRVLRLMPQPLYRYPELDQGRPGDGGIFSLAVGNDPELLLIIELVDGQSGPQWQYGLARSTRSTTVAQLDEVEVWRYDAKSATPENKQNTYLSVHGIATLPLEPPAEARP